MAGPSQSAIRMGARALALSLVAFIGACTGGPHPLPPERGIAVNNPQTAPTSNASTPTMAVDSKPDFGNPAGVAGAAATPPPTATPAGMNPAPTTPASMTPPTQPVTPPPAQGPAAAGSGASTPTTGTSAPGAMPGSAGAGGTSGSAGSGGMDPAPTCDGPTGALSAAETAPSRLLFVLDRSVSMSSDFAGEPRWQRSSEALMHTVNPRGSALMMGALLYPSGTATASTCTGPDWLCSLQAQDMCTVNPMASQDQVAFQPASQALGTLLGSNGLYTPVSANGVPLGQSLQRADAALAAQSATGGRTSVVIIASGAPSCDWDSAQASAILKRWYSERGVRTHVIALPGSTGASSNALAALAEAGGTGDVRAPQSVGAFEATLQSIVFDSLSSCSLVLDPPAPDPSAVQVLVTDMGVEQVLPRTSSSGETLWTISPDGKTVTLLGTACDAAKGGAYDAIRIVFGCARR